MIQVHTIQSCGALGLARNPLAARFALFSMRRLLIDIAVTDTQQEELTCYVSQSEDLDTALRWTKSPGSTAVSSGNPNAVWTSDKVTKKLLEAKNCSRMSAMLLAGDRKVDVVSHRAVDKSLKEYSTRNVEALY